MLAGISNTLKLHSFDVSKIFVLFIVAVVSTLLYLGGVLDPLEKFTLDQRFKSRQRLRTHPKIIVIEIDERSLTKAGRWPWGRHWHAAIVRALKGLGADAVGFDILFKEPNDSERDYDFAKEIAKAQNVYLPLTFEESEGDRGEGLLKPLPIFADAAKGLGHIRAIHDADGLVRRTRLRMEHEGKVYYQLGLLMALHHLGTEAQDVRVEDGIMYIPVAHNTALQAPLTGSGELIINWAGKWKDVFTHVSFVDVIATYSRHAKGEATRLDPKIFKGSLCVIGGTSAGLYDIKAIPLEPVYPGMGITVNILNSILRGDFLRPVGKEANIAILWFLSFIVMIIMLKTRYLLFSLLVALVSGLYLVISLLAFRMDVIMNIVYPLFLLFFSYLVLTMYHQFVISFEKKKLLRQATKDALTGLYNIGHFKLLLAAEIKSLQFRRIGNLSVIMVDIDHFKKVNDSYGHASGDEVLKGLAEILKSGCRALDVAARYGGEEFVLMLPGAINDDAVTVAEKIRRLFEEKKFVLGSEKSQTRITGSFGVSTYVMGESVDSFVKRADQALYEAKGSGRNCVKSADS